jgi:hypothetical protein
MPQTIKDAQMKTKRRLAKERMLTCTIVILVISFFLSWLPYALVSMYVTFVDASVPPLLGTIPSMVAKSSMLWTSLFYLFTNTNFKSKLSFNFSSNYATHDNIERISNQ